MEVQSLKNVLGRALEHSCSAVESTRAWSLASIFGASWKPYVVPTRRRTAEKRADISARRWKLFERSRDFAP